MTLSDLAAIGSLVSGLAVLVSLVYLAQQTRQSAANQRAAVHQGRASIASDLLLRMAEPSLLQSFFRAQSGNRELTAEEFAQYFLVYSALITGWEDQFVQHQAGMLSDDRFHVTVAAVTAHFQIPANRALWKVHTASVIARDFLAFVEERIAEGRKSSQPDTFSDWKAELAAESALGSAA